MSRKGFLFVVCLIFSGCAAQKTEHWKVEVNNGIETEVPINSVEPNVMFVPFQIGELSKRNFLLSRPSDDSVFIPVQIDKGQVINFLFSTSSHDTVLLGNKRTRGASWQSIGGGFSPELIPGFEQYDRFIATKGKTLNIGDATFDNVNLFRVNEDEFLTKKLAPNFSVDGYIGGLLLSSYIVDVDRKNDKFRLRPKDTDLKAELSQYENVVTLPVRRNNGKIFTKLPVQINENDAPVPMLLSIESAIPTGILFPNSFDKKIIKGSQYEIFDAKYPTDKVEGIVLRKITQISTNAYDFKDINALYLSFNDDSLQTTSSIRNYGILGAEFLARSRNIYDLDHNVMYLIPYE
ncbi:hypothetical protein MAH1_04230 [Sessilibacter sp. MAH1]